MAIAGISSPDYAMTRVFGNVAIAHAILRRLSTPKGGLLGAPTYGYDLRSAIGSTTSTTLIAQRVREQCMADERVDDVAVSVSLGVDGVLNVTIDVKTSAGPFTLQTLTADQLTYRMLVDKNPVFWGAL